MKISSNLWKIIVLGNQKSRFFNLRSYLLFTNLSLESEKDKVTSEWKCQSFATSKSPSNTSFLSSPDWTRSSGIAFRLWPISTSYHMLITFGLCFEIFSTFAALIGPRIGSNSLLSHFTRFCYWKWKIESWKQNFRQTICQYGQHDLHVCKFDKTWKNSKMAWFWFLFSFFRWAKLRLSPLKIQNEIPCIKDIWHILEEVFGNLCKLEIEMYVLKLHCS